MLSKNKIKYIRSLAQKKHRTVDGVFVAEGIKLVADLLPYFTVRYIAATEQWFYENSQFSSCFPSDCDIVTDEELCRISALESPQSVLAIFEQQIDDTPLSKAALSDICLVLDDVQNPGNLGTIIRVADWFGIRHIYCSQTTADVYGPKTVQATMGSLSRVHVHYIDIKENLLALQNSNIPIYGTFLPAPSLYDVPLSNNGIIIMGNEGNGISPAVASYVNQRLFIPSFPPGSTSAESLNVAIATAIICAEFRRR